MRHLLFTVFATLLLCTFAQAQELLYKKRDRVIKYMQSRCKDQKMEMATTDSTVLFDIAPGTATNTKILALFDAKGRCIKQTFIENCEECFKKHIRKFTIDAGWEYMNENRYTYSILLSIPTKELLINSRTAPYSFTLQPIYTVKKKA